MIATPTVNTQWPLQLGGFASLAEALDYAAHGDTGINMLDARGELSDSLSYRQLRRRALAAARQLLQSGLAHGTRIGLVAETGVDFLVLFYACQYAGLVPCPLPARPAFGAADAYAEALRRCLACAEIPLLVVPANLHAAIEPACADLAEVRPYTQYQAEAATVAQAAATPCEVAYVQFSSGSTSAPKGVLVTQRALMANATAIARDGLRMRAEDRAFSWLPLFHDMGLVGFSVVALCGQRSVDYWPPAGFAARPWRWLSLMTRQRSTIVYAPPFAWQLVAQRQGEHRDIDLSALRIAGVGGDMLEPELLEACMQRLERAGLRAQAFQPSYGMAEATLAISMSDADLPPAIDDVALARTRDGHLVAARTTRTRAARRIVSAGRPLPGVEVEVRHGNGAPLADRHVGHLWVRGDNVMQHYASDASADMRDARGFFDSGDLGYLHEGQLFVTGRAKDMIPVRGRNIWLRDLEWAAERVPPLRRGDVAAIALNLGQAPLVLLVQRVLPASHERQALRERVTEAVLAALGVHVLVQFVPPRSFPYTTSGKLARQQLGQLYAAGLLAPPSDDAVLRDLEPTT